MVNVYTVKKRIEYLDQLKAIAIIFVVIGHSIENNTLESSQSPLFSWIYSFHMPLFMFISGYVAFKTMRINTFTEFFPYIKGRALTLLVPYFMWSVVIKNFFFVSKMNTNILKEIVLAATTWNVYWFLFVLFVLTIIYTIFFIISKKINTNNNIIIELLIFIVTTLLLVVIKMLHIFTPVVDINTYLLYFFYFFTGHFVAKFYILSNIFLEKRMFAIFALAFILFSGRYNFHDLGVPNKIIKTIVSISAIASLYYIVNKANWSPIVAKYLKIIGQNTLAIYTTHFALNYLVKDRPPLLSHLSNFSLITFTLIFSMCVIAGCIIIKRIVEISPYFNFCLYGQKIKVKSAI